MSTITLTAKPVSEPTYRRRPEEDAPEFITYQPSGETPTVFVRRAVIERIVDHTHQNGPDEAIGFLAGRVYQDDDGLWVVVSDAWCCGHARASRTTVETTDRDQEELDAWRQGAGLALDRLGWWHSHYELRFHHYSGVDRENQKLWSPRPWQVGLLVLVDDGVARVRCYRGPESDSLTPLRRTDGAAEEVPVARRRLVRRERTPSEKTEIACFAPTPHPTPLIRWERVALAVAASLLVAAIVGFGSGWAPTPSQLFPGHDAVSPAQPTREARHVGR